MLGKPLVRFCEGQGRNHLESTLPTRRLSEVVSKLSGCHRLAWWSLTLAATKGAPRILMRHGVVPWSLTLAKAIRLTPVKGSKRENSTAQGGGIFKSSVCLVAASVNLNRARRWHPKSFDTVSHESSIRPRR